MSQDRVVALLQEACSLYWETTQVETILVMCKHLSGLLSHSLWGDICTLSYQWAGKARVQHTAPD
ncbi:hypothetical protein DPMN_041429 [Dreissena polymorpha]|uniref:Uncharacterized protein n=1 Tax=Dreissena polymorpha TaxID=45954 RepID=A0A9D4CYM1_DREPO|nr:hypothetical protein DPMN_041429 [Dreissena polymorpha]